MKKIFSRKSLVAGAAVAVMVAAGFAMRSEAETLSVAELPQHTHIHGLAVDRTDTSRLLIATHHGLFRTGSGNQAERISEIQDFMGFNAHPSDAGTLYASGHPPSGGNLGFIASRDGGRSWTQLSPGVDGPVDFHQMTVSPADPATIYGAYGSLQISRDGGETWTIAGPTPSGLIDLAASASQSDTLYAATETGLLVSTDAGATWQSLLDGGPVTLVEVTPDGALYAFILGRGLVYSPEEPFEPTTVSDGFERGYLLHLAVHPDNPERLFAATGEGVVVTSTDRGKTWSPFGGSGS